MKRITYIFCFILVFVWLVGTILQATQDYKHERTLWWIQHDFQKISHPTSLENENVVNKIIERYQLFIRKNPKSNLAPKAQLMIANTLRQQNKYQQAREIFEEIVSNYRYNAEVTAQAEFGIGQTYENEDNWPKAVTVYRSIIRDYPITVTGFSIPLYLGTFYQVRGLNSTAVNAYAEATEFYQNIATSYPESPLGLSALKMAIKSQLAIGQWMGAYYTAKEALLEYPLASSISETVQSIFDICVKNMNNPRLAINAYREFLEKNPGHPMRNQFFEIIQELQRQSQFNEK